MKVLHLTLKKQWFDMINSGEKTEEYREIKPYWIIRFLNGMPLHPSGNDFKTFSGVLFRNGYSSDSRQRSFKFESISIGEGRPEWGAEPGKKYFIIKFSPWL